MNIVLAIKYFFGLFNLKQSYIMLSVALSFLFSLLTKLSIDNIIKYICLKEMFDPILIITVLLCVATTFVFSDLFFGLLVAKRNKKELTSKGWEKTISKLFGIFLYLVVSLVVILYTVNIVILTFVYTPLFLVILKEFTSIGENMKKLNGKKPYIFTIIDKLFDILEGKFYDKLKEK